ncbi:hypothetical protein FISHEDRAFT_69150 [Fistulina hepatica ATCC 64428]|uniref:Uncharacterized protein n=1 Tax=Fistulina hepatica ATCC 64428 TaxID=1128425 RepID=A0A0D7ANI5_9AGAR|nr:hypothetical protein FISHEDRAFT_69150 [Fistulina hepatica ATCC 64428]
MTEPRTVYELRSRTVIACVTDSSFCTRRRGTQSNDRVDVVQALHPCDIAQITQDTHDQGCNSEPTACAHTAPSKTAPDYVWLNDLSQQLASTSIADASCNESCPPAPHPIIFNRTVTASARPAARRGSSNEAQTSVLPDILAPGPWAGAAHTEGTVHIYNDEVERLLMLAAREDERDAGASQVLAAASTLDEAPPASLPAPTSPCQKRSGTALPPVSATERPTKKPRTSSPSRVRYKKPTFKQWYGHLPRKERARIYGREKRTTQKRNKVQDQPHEAWQATEAHPFITEADREGAGMFVTAAHELPISRTGWQGQNHNRWQVVKDLWASWSQGKIWDVVCTFLRIPFAEDIESQAPTLILDTIGRLVAVRSTIGGWMWGLMPAIIADHQALVHACANPMDRFSNLRGLHWASIMGHHRNSQPWPILSEFHRKNIVAIEALMATESFKRLNGMASALVETYFPGVAARFRNNHVWMKDRHGISPLFGLFWNYCVNHALPDLGVPRVFCAPHADWKNLAIAVCAIFVYGDFDHRTKCWLCIWDFGIVIQIPPGCFMLYPSALLFHFNVDIVESEVEPKKPGEGISLYVNADWANANGRGSCVWFNQASMFVSELDSDSLAEAICKGLDGRCDKDALIAAGLFPTIIN